MVEQLDRNTVIRNVQEIATDLWLGESQSGKTGKGKVWRPILLVPNPRVGTVHHTGSRWEWAEHKLVAIGHVKPAQNSYRKSMQQFAARLWETDHSRCRYVEAFFETEERAVKFLLLNGPEFLK